MLLLSITGSQRSPWSERSKTAMSIGLSTDINLSRGSEEAVVSFSTEIITGTVTALLIEGLVFRLFINEDNL